MSSDLIKALRAQVEFDGAAVHKAAREYWQNPVSFIEAAGWQHDRLKPILEKLIAVVESADKSREVLVPELEEPGRTAFWLLANSLDDLRLVVMGEGR